MNRYEKIFSGKNDGRIDETAECKNHVQSNKDKADLLYQGQVALPPSPISDLTYIQVWGEIDSATGLRSSHSDPCAEICPEDSRLWVGLLHLTEIELNNPYLCGALKYMRLIGTRLKPNDTYGYILSPEFDETGQQGWGWESKKLYDREKRRILDPHRRELVQLLGRLKAVAG